jgi:hypothetical protein
VHARGPTGEQRTRFLAGTVARRAASILQVVEKFADFRGAISCRSRYSGRWHLYAPRGTAHMARLSRHAARSRAG